MAGTNDFVTFAAAAGANVMAQADYLAMPALLTGFAAGVAQSAQLNKVWRQSSIMSAVVGQFICDQTGQNATDDGTTTTLLANFKTAVQSYSRIRLAAPLTIYVSPSGSDVAGNGLTAGTPFQTITYAYNFIRNNYDLNGNSVTIQLANGTYGQAILNDRIPGQTGSSSITINGSATAGAVSIAASANGQGLVAVIGGAIINLSGITITSGSFTGCIGILCYPFSTALIGSNVTFGAMPGGTHIQCQQGQVQLTNYTISGSATQHFVAAGGYIQLLGVGTVTGSPSFTTFATSQNLGSIIGSATASYSGSATGTRYSCIMNGVINTLGAGASFFPGSVAGSTANGGQYN